MEQTDPAMFRCSIERIRPMKGQPRETFDEQALTELAQSLREHGLVEPLVVRRRGQDFELIAGERRWRAAKLAALTEVPVVVREATDREALEVALVENIQRESLTEIEVAKALRRLQEEHGYTQEALADRLGRDRSTIANTLALLRLPADTQKLIGDRLLTGGHGRALAKLVGDPNALRTIQSRVVAECLSVRATERLVRGESAYDPLNRSNRSIDAYEAAVDEVTVTATGAAAAGIDLYQLLEEIERSDVWKVGRHANFGEFLAKHWPNSLGLHRYKSVIGAIGVYGADVVRAVGAEAAHCLLDPAIVENEQKRAAVLNDLRHHIKQHGAAPQVAEIRRLVRHHAGELQHSDVADRAAANRERDAEVLRLRKEAAEAKREGELLRKQLKKLETEVTDLRRKNEELLRRNADLSKQVDGGRR